MYSGHIKKLVSDALAFGIIF